MAKQQTRNRIPVRGRPGERERKDPNQPDPRPEQRFPGRDRQDDPNQRRRIDERIGRVTVDPRTIRMSTIGTTTAAPKRKRARAGS